MSQSANEVTKDQLIADFNVMVEDAEALLQATANQGGEEMAVVRARVEESLGVAKARLMEVQDVLIVKTREAAQATDKYVHESPWNVIGLAAGFGLLVGFLVGRR